MEEKNKDFKNGINVLKGISLTTSEKDESFKNITERIALGTFLYESSYSENFNFLSANPFKKDKDFKRGVNFLKEVSLTISEKDKSFKNILKGTRVMCVSCRNPYFSYFSFLNIRTPYQYLKVSLILVLLVFGSIAYAAENALPGDRTYPVKINVNEFVKGALTFGTFEKVNWQTEKISRRAIEAEELAKQGRLSGVSTEDILVSLNSETNNLDKNINVLNQSDIGSANNARLGLAVKADIQSRVLNEIKSTVDTEQEKNIQLVDEALIKATEKVGMRDFLNNYSIGDTKTDVNVGVNSKAV